MAVPTDVHARVLDLVTDLTDASLRDDTRAQWRLYGELRDYCESEVAAGRDHPFLWESLADFTTDHVAAVALYQRGLVQARRISAVEYEASILFELAQRHAQDGAMATASDLAWQANELAARTDDLDLRRDISQFLLTCTPDAHESEPCGPEPGCTPP